MVYRGAVSFTLTARSEGELLENNQVVLMMRLSLCMIWISVFQHILTTNPHVPLQVPEGIIQNGNTAEGNCFHDCCTIYQVRNINNITDKVISDVTFQKAK